MLLFLQNLAAFPVTITTFCPPFQARTLTRHHTTKKDSPDLFVVCLTTKKQTLIVCSFFLCFL